VVSHHGPEVSVVLPCLNEAATIGASIERALRALAENGLDGEIVVCDNGSTDHSPQIARDLGARVVEEPRQGYGFALRKGIEEARGQYVVIADADDTYDLGALPAFLAPLRAGHEFVVGDRFAGGIEPGAMPWLHQHVGTPVLSWTLGLLFGTRVADSQCGMRAFSRTAYRKMRLRTTGMEFASEMLVNAMRAGLAVAQAPVRYHPRRGESKLRTFRDGWRHLRFMLLYSPVYLFWVPGGIMSVLGLLILAALTPGPLVVNGRALDLHLLVVGALLTILGIQTLSLGLYARTYALTEGFDEHDPVVEGFYRRFTLERGILIGGAALLIGLAGDGYILWHWIGSGFGSLNETRLAIFGLTFIVVGSQIVFSSFLLSLMGIRHTRDG
jgi:hypothetical protein